MRIASLLLGLLFGATAWAHEGDEFAGPLTDTWLQFCDDLLCHPGTCGTSMKIDIPKHSHYGPVFYQPPSRKAIKVHGSYGATFKLMVSPDEDFSCQSDCIYLNWKHGQCYHIDYLWDSETPPKSFRFASDPPCYPSQCGPKKDKVNPCGRPHPALDVRGRWVDTIPTDVKCINWTWWDWP